MTTRRTFMGSAAAVATVAAVTTHAAPSPSRSRNVTGAVKLRDGTELFVRDWGSGRPVLLTHAWPLSSDCWEQQTIALIDAGYRVISYDRRGFGRSSQPASGYDYNTYADDLAEIIQATGVKDTTLIGFSMGGGEIVRYLSRHGSKNVIKAGLVATVVPGLAKSRNNPNGVDPAFFDGLKDSLRKDRATFLSGLLKDVFYDVETSAKSTHPVSQAVLDRSWQMGMQAGLLARQRRQAGAIRADGATSRGGHKAGTAHRISGCHTRTAGHGTRTCEQGPTRIPEGAVARVSSAKRERRPKAALVSDPSTLPSAAAGSRLHTQSRRGSHLRFMKGRECRQIDLLDCAPDGVLVAVTPVHSIAQAQ